MFKKEFYKHMQTAFTLHKEMNFSIKDFFSKCNQIRKKLQMGSHLLNKSLMKNFIFVQCHIISKGFVITIVWLYCLCGITGVMSKELDAKLLRNFCDFNLVLPRFVHPQNLCNIINFKIILKRNQTSYLTWINFVHVEP